jgi:flavodoxin
MKALVAYHSRTGNTEKLARAIFEAIHFEKEILPLREVKSFEGYDVIFLGFPVQAHSVPAAVIPFFGKLPPGQPLALFSTHGSLRGGQLPRQAFEQALGLAAKARVLGTFGVRGTVDPQVIDALSRQLEHQGWAEEARSAHGHPDEADLADGREFARGILARAGR